jgi:hypothetical protein
MNSSMDAQATSPTTADPQLPANQVAGVDAPVEPVAPGFRERGRMRRRLRFLRRARELAYRDLGGLVFEMHRLSQRRDDLVQAKLATLGRIDAEVRSLEGALGELGHVTVLREPGVTACPRCAAIHASEDRFCPACGLAMGRNADRPIAPAPPPAAAVPTPTPAPTPAPAPAPTPVTPAAPHVAAAPVEVDQQPTQVIPAVPPAEPGQSSPGE